MAQILVADISRWQGTINFDVFKNSVQAVVIKMSGSDGGLYPDGMGARNRDEARRVGMGVAYYHYKGSESPENQADYFLRVIGEIRAGEFVVIDDENENKVNSAFCAAFAKRIKDITGLAVPVYSNLSRFQGVDLSSISSLPAWVAKYGNNTGNRADSGDAPQISGMNIVMWQYTSMARVAGCSENTVDMNVFYGSIDDFKALGAKGTVPAPSGPAAPAAVQATGNGEYVIQPGDTLSGIGSKLGIDWKTIAATNGIFAPYTIYAGHKLKVYGGAMNLPQASSKSYTVVSGDTLSGIGSKTGVDWTKIAELNKIPAPYVIYPGNVLQLGGSADNTTATYTVHSGDSLSGIGAKLNKDWQQIASKNKISPPYTIYPNQVLQLP